MFTTINYSTPQNEVNTSIFSKRDNGAVKIKAYALEFYKHKGFAFSIDGFITVLRNKLLKTE